MKLLTYKIMLNISSWLRVAKKYNNMPLSNPKHNSTHVASTDSLDSPEDMPKPNFASQPGHNFGPSKLLRQPNKSEPRRTVSGPM